MILTRQLSLKLQNKTIKKKIVKQMTGFFLLGMMTSLARPTFENDSQKEKESLRGSLVIFMLHFPKKNM